MGYDTISELVETWWNKVNHYVNGAALFLDDAAAECLHWHGGLKRMIDAGAVEIKNFVVSEKMNSVCKKAVFLLTSPLKDNVFQTAMTIVRSNNFKNTVIITSLPPRCHDDRHSDESNIFSFLEKCLLSWMGNMNYVACIEYIPLYISCLSTDLFIMPVFSKDFMPLSTHFLLGQDKKAAESSLKQLPTDLQSITKMFVCCLSALLDGLQVKADIFSLGQLSHLMAAELENVYHATKGKAHKNKASVLLIDRSLDLAGPLSHSTDTLLGKMLQTLPHLPGHVSDVSICMSELAACSSGCVLGYPLLAPGCLAHKSNSTEVSVLDALLYSKSKEAIMEVIRRIVQLAVTEHLRSDSGITATPKTLKKKILLFKEKPELVTKHSGLLQQALAVTQVLEHPKSSYLDNLLATEILLLQNLCMNRSGIASDVMRLISSRKERNYKLNDILTLIAFLYALDGPNIFEEEDKTSVQATIIEALFQDDDETKELIEKLVEDDESDQCIISAVKYFFKILEDMGDLRSNLKKYKSVFEYGIPALPSTYTSLLKQVISDIFSSNEVTDIEYHSAGLRNYIKTGFSLFMNITKPQPMDNPLLIVIILGGITPNELREIHELANHHKSKVQVLFGSTSLLSPSDVMNDLFSIVRCSSVEENEEEL